MRVLYVGNAANTPYICAKRIRNWEVQSKLVFLNRHITNHPLWVEIDTDLSELSDSGGQGECAWTDEQLNKLPDWVSPVQVDTNTDFLKKPSTHWRMVRTIRDVDCDVIHAWNLFSAIWASFSGKPYIYHITGHYDWQRDELVNNRLFRTLLKGLIKRAIRNAELVVGLRKWLTEFELRYPNVETRELLPILDTDLFKPVADGDERRDGLCLFAGARHDWETKRNDILFKGLADLDKTDLHLKTVEWGRDVQRSKELVSELGLKDFVSFVPLLSKPRLARTIRDVDAVLDQFRFGFGSLARQTLACGTPLISTVDVNRWEEPPPILRASTPDEVTRQIGKIETENESIRSRSVEWIRRHYDQETLMQRYMQLYKRCSSG